MKVIGLSLPIIITLLLSVRFLIFPKKRSLSLNLLGAFFLLFSFTLSAILFQYLQEFYPSIGNYFYVFEMVFYAAMLSLPILVFFYVISLIDYIKPYETFNRFAIHFAIPVLSLLFNLYSFSLQTSDNSFIYKATEFFNFFSLKVIFILLNVYYISRVIVIYKRHRTRLTNVLSFDYGISLNWILFFLFGYLVFVFCFFILNPNSSPYVVYLPLFLIVTYLFFQRHAQINISLEEHIDEPHFKSEKYAIKDKVELVEEEFSAPLDLEKRAVLKARISEVMESQEPYLKKDLTVYELATIVQTNSTYLSFVLNNDFNANFASFINNYRIEKAKDYFLDLEKDKFTIEAISSEVGFHSKSAFNVAFKRRTGLTPSKFKANRGL